VRVDAAQIGMYQHIGRLFCMCFAATHVKKHSAGKAAQDTFAKYFLFHTAKVQRRNFSFFLFKLLTINSLCLFRVKFHKKHKLRGNEKPSLVSSIQAQ